MPVRYFFTEEGNFADSLCRVLYQGPKGGGAGGNYLVMAPQVADAVLRETLASCGLEHDPFTANLSLHVGPATVDPTGERAGFRGGATLSYATEWPLSLVLTDGCMQRYLKMWDLMMSVRRYVQICRLHALELTLDLMAPVGRSETVHCNPEPWVA